MILLIIWIVLLLVNYLLGFALTTNWTSDTDSLSKNEARFFSLYPLWGGFSTVLFVLAVICGFIYEIVERVTIFKRLLKKLYYIGWK